MSLSLPIPIPSITPPPEPSDPEPSSQPPSSNPPPSSGGPSSGGPSSGGPSSGGPSSGGPSSSGGGGSSSAPPSSSSEPESSRESTLSQDSTSVFSSTSVIVTDGSTITTVMPVTTVIESGSVVTNPPTAAAASAPVGAIVGGVIGGLVGLLALGALIFFFMKRRKHNFDKEFDGNFDPDYVSKHNTGSNVFTTGLGGAAAGAAATTNSHRKSHSLEKAGGGKQRVNLNNGMDRASLEAAALAEDDGMGGRLDASTVGGGIVTPFPYPQGQAPPQGYPQQPMYNSPASPPPGGHMALGAAGAAGAGYYAGQHQHHGQQPYGYGQQPYGGQGYPDRLNGAISPISSDGTHSYPNSANPYLSGAPASSQGHSNAYGGYADPSNQSVYGGVAPSVTGTSVSGYHPPPQHGGFGGGVGTFGAAGAVMSSGASTHSSAGTGGPAGPLSYTTGSGAGGMSAKEREARGLGRPGMAVANPDERPENRRAEGSAGSVLPSPFDAALGSSSAAVPRPSGKAAEANVGNRTSGVVVHTDGGRVDEEESAPGEIPPAYDSLLYERK